jgi:hypothetical protein
VPSLHAIEWRETGLFGVLLRAGYALVQLLMRPSCTGSKALASSISLRAAASVLS